MQIDLDDIYFSGNVRARDDYGDIEGLTKSLANNGQLQPIVVRPFDPEEYPADAEADGDFEFTVVDGGRRYTAITILDRQDVEIPELDPGKIDARFREDVDRRKALLWEYKANEDRKDFDWREKAKHIRRIHEAHEEEHDNWNQQHTAEVLDTTKKTVSVYLQLTDNKEFFNHPKLQEADTFRTAHKQLKILRENKRRERVADQRSKMDELREEGALGDVSEDDVAAVSEAGAMGSLSDRSSMSDSPPQSSDGEEDEDSLPGTSEFDREDDIPLITNDDARYWLTDIPDETFDWIHWDPPYGGEQAGGAFTSQKDIDDDWESASRLMRETIPEIHRVLREGDWLAIWCHPTRTNWLARYLRGHVRDTDSNQCEHCGRPWRVDALEEVCLANPDWRFWVNPYPNIWYKSDRHSDGHEIRRFLVNQYETFLLASKVVDQDTEPVLVESQEGNVMDFPMPVKADRRHVMHKPKELIKKIISLISVPGSLGADPSAGSGSVIEAAIESSRKIKVCEIDEDYARTCVDVAKESLERVSVDGFSFAE